MLHHLHEGLGGVFGVLHGRGNGWPRRTQQACSSATLEGNVVVERRSIDRSWCSGGSRCYGRSGCLPPTTTLRPPSPVLSIWPTPCRPSQLGDIESEQVRALMPYMSEAVNARGRGTGLEEPASMAPRAKPLTPSVTPRIYHIVRRERCPPCSRYIRQGKPTVRRREGRSASAHLSKRAVHPAMPN